MSAISPLTSLVSGLSAQATGKTATEANGALGKQDFLNLLLTQMRYQNPLDPLSNSEFVAQTAQFSSLEQLLSMSEAFTGLQATIMLGRNVKANTMTGTTIEGTVKSVNLSGQTPLLTLNDGSLVDMKDVFEVSN